MSHGKPDVYEELKKELADLHGDYKDLSSRVSVIETTVKIEVPSLKEALSSNAEKMDGMRSKLDRVAYHIWVGVGIVVTLAWLLKK